jgi:endonuclease/exonuclease/phosphatase family metal-dependent hydrolase
MCAAAFAQAPTPGDKTVQLTVMTYNLRYGTAKDGDNAWDLRKDLLVENIRQQDPDILGTQEGLDFQLDYIKEKLGPNYRWFGIARDGDGTGEHSAVFYRCDRLAPVETGNFWLSETPDRPGTLSWDTHLNRLATWARFIHLASGRSFYYYNTHLDHASEEARFEGARLIAKHFMPQLVSQPVIVTGDFNAVAEASDPWRVLTAAGGLHDAWCAAKAHSGPECTFNGFKPLEPGAKGRIDWILVPPSAQVDSCTIVDRTPDGRFPSDHFPVVARIALPE